MNIEESREFARKTTKAVRCALRDHGHAWDRMYNDRRVDGGRSIKVIGLTSAGSSQLLRNVGYRLSREYGLSATVPTPKGTNSWRIQIAPPPRAVAKAEKPQKTSPFPVKQLKKDLLGACQQAQTSGNWTRLRCLAGPQIYIDPVKGGRSVKICGVEFEYYRETLEWIAKKLRGKGWRATVPPPKFGVVRIRVETPRIEPVPVPAESTASMQEIAARRLIEDTCMRRLDESGRVRVIFTPKGVKAVMNVSLSKLSKPESYANVSVPLARTDRHIFDTLRTTEEHAIHQTLINYVREQGASLSNSRGGSIWPGVDVAGDKMLVVTYYLTEFH